MLGELEAMRPLLDASGVRSHSSFVRDALLVTARRKQPVWSVTPWRREGKAFRPGPGELVVGDRATAEELGRIIHQALEQSS
jgi:hypothetical protein